jgi:hypothetical protein
LRRVAFFLTDGDSEHETVFQEMAALAGREPVASLGLPRDKRGHYAEAVESFTDS